MTQKLTLGRAPEAPVRSWANGYRACRRTFTEPPCMADWAAIAAVRATGLDFAGVDVLVSPKGRVCVLEVNSAPGDIVGQTLAAYVDSIRQVIEEMQS